MELLYYYMMRILFKGNRRAGHEHRGDHGAGVKDNAAAGNGQKMQKDIWKILIFSIWRKKL